MKELDKGLNAVMWFIMAATMLFLVVAASWQIFTRTVLNNPSTITEELMRYMLIWAGMIGSAYCFYKNQHLALDLVKDRLKGLPLKIVNIICEVVIMFFVVFVFLWGGYRISSGATHSSPVMGIPMSWLFMVFPVSGGFIILARILQYAQMLTNKKEGDE